MARTIQQLKIEIKDLGERLYYCSDTGEGRTMRKAIEELIREREQELNQLINQCAGCINDSCINCSEQ